MGTDNASRPAPPPDTATPEKVRLNARKLLGHFGGAHNAARLAEQHGVAGITYNAAKNWRRRGQVSAEGIAALVELGIRLEKPVVMQRFVEPAE
jgi:hypothetical protein